MVYIAGNLALQALCLSAAAPLCQGFLITSDACTEADSSIDTSDGSILAELIPTTEMTDFVNMAGQTSCATATCAQPDGSPALNSIPSPQDFFVQPTRHLALEHPEPTLFWRLGSPGEARAELPVGAGIASKFDNDGNNPPKTKQTTLLHMSPQVKAFISALSRKTRKDGKGILDILIPRLPQADLQMIHGPEESVIVTIHNVPAQNWEDLNQTPDELQRVLRRLGAGPLWVRKNHNQSTIEFRFAIPRKAFQKASILLHSESDPNSTRSTLEYNLDEGFAVHPQFFHLAIHEFHELITKVEDQHPEEGLPTRRLEILHQLLAGPRDLTSLTVVDNGPGHVLELASALARLGTSVIMKEPHSNAISSLSDKLETLPEDIRKRIVLKTTRGEIDKPSPADIAYWSYPLPDPYQALKEARTLPNDPLLLMHLVSQAARDFSESESNSAPTIVPPIGQNLIDYIGRDVRPGGFLVIESDFSTDPSYVFGRWDIRNLPPPWHRFMDRGWDFIVAFRQPVLPSIISEGTLMIFQKRKS